MTLPRSAYDTAKIRPWASASRVSSGMGDSDKLPNSGPDRYTYAEHRSFLFALWEELKLGNEIVFVVHDWGSALGFDWANQHRDRVQGLAYMEAIVMPMAWSDFPERACATFRAFRSPAATIWSCATTSSWNEY
jgi:haloalkane dehalogenase